MKRCVMCNREFPDSGVFCPYDGGTLADDNSEAFIGKVLDGKYRIDSRISAGGMGTVYRATHVLMDSKCAVKVMHDSMVSDPQSVSRFQREAKAAAKIRHPNAIAVMDFGITTDKIVYLVMELFEGTSLRQELQAHGPFTLERAAVVLERAAAALAVAHELGIVHRDVKPDNIMVRPLPNGDEEVKVLDFGIAKLKDMSGGTEQLTNAGMVIGTPNYLSPEQCRAAELDARSDIYALGIVAYELLCGEVPFSAATPLAVAMAHTTQPPPSLVEKVPGLPQEVEDVVFAALAKHPDDRPTHAVDFARAFAEAAIGYSTVQSTSYLPTRPANTPAGGVGAATTALGGGQNTYSGRRTTGSTAAAVAPGQSTRITGAPALTPSETVHISVPDETSARKPVMLWAGVAAAAILLLGGAAYMLRPGTASVDTPPPVVEPNEAPTPAAVPDDMVLIPAGSFKMGRDTKDAAEGPPHDVSVASFYLDKTEVTNEQYARFVKEKNYPAPASWQGGTYPLGQDDFPVTDVSWLDARAFAKWAGKRLPTEQEWEYAARSSENLTYPWGSDPRPEAAHTKEGKITTPQPVGSLSAGVSPFGVFDLVGNVWEWCEDGFTVYPGSKYEPTPVDPGCKIIRGGSFATSLEEATASTRNWKSPEYKDQRLGFRCAKSAE
jgi:eukaryotic-like serine/threonine-protein kinase